MKSAALHLLSIYRICPLRKAVFIDINISIRYYDLTTEETCFKKSINDFFFYAIQFFTGGMLKYNSYEENELFSVIKPVCDGYDASIVRLSSAVINKTLQINLVLYQKGGIGIDQCGTISRAVMPRIEVWAENRDVSLEISSPGIGRILKDAYEFQVFAGEKIQLLIDSQWLTGDIVEAGTESVDIKTENGETVKYMFDSIQKAKLY